MNAAATFAMNARHRRGRRGLSVGWSASLLVHAAIVAWLLHAPAPRPPDAVPGKRIEVRLAPPTPAPTPAASAQATAPVTPPRSGPAPARASAPTPAYATRPAPAHETPDTNPQPSAPTATPADASAAPAADTAAETPAAAGVDIASARAAARLIARQEGKSLVALPARKPVVDPNADRAKPVDPIEAARKGDCKTAYAGAGLLAIIPLAASAVMDTGCKW